MQFLREILKPFAKFCTDASFREYVRVKKICRNKKDGEEMRIRVGGLTIHSNNASALLHLYEEAVVHRAYDIDLKGPSPVIIIAGANNGLETALLASKYPSAKIIAFEADAALAEICRENMKRNRINNVEIIAKAVWITGGELRFRSDGALGGKVNTGDASVPCVRLADVLQKFGKIDLLLMDIEGAETAVLKDCREQLMNIDSLFVEWHSSQNKKQDLPELLQLLAENGFRYRIHNILPDAPFTNRIIENDFDAMTGIYAERR